MSKKSGSVATILGLSAGALGWSSLAEAARDDHKLQTILLPDHYLLQDDGTVIIQLETGERLSLNTDQYVILEGGLLLVVDEVAQNALSTLPVMGSFTNFMDSVWVVLVFCDVFMLGWIN